MDGLIASFQANPFWAWLAAGAVLLIAEAATGSGWLLWPAVSAGVTAVLSLTGLVPSPVAQAAIFALLTVGTTLLAKPWTSKAPKADLNDRAQRMIGRIGQAREDFAGGRGRVFVDGAEWTAELDGGGELEAGASVKVTRVEGARLFVSRG